MYRSSLPGAVQMKSLLLVCVNKVSWNIANTTCVEMGGQLTDPYSSSKNPVVEEAVNAAKYALVHKYGTSGSKSFTLPFENLVFLISGLPRLF